MLDCENQVRLGAYYDGELSPSERADVEAHLRGCPSCAAEFAAMARMSGVFAESIPRRPSNDQLIQIARSVGAEASNARMLLTLLRRTAVAAAVLLACSLGGAVYLSQQSKAAAHETMVLDHVASRSQPVAFATDPVSDEKRLEQQVYLAQWIASDLSGRREEP